VLASGHVSAKTAHPEIAMSGPANTEEPYPDRLVPVLSAAAEFFAEEALTFAAVLHDPELAPMSPADAVRLFGDWLRQLAQDLGDALSADTIASVPHLGLVS
jgi:hypothetical protein